MKERIQKLLGNAGVASRRNIEEMVRQGRVTVNGRVVVDLPVMVDPLRDKVAVDGESVKLARRVVRPMGGAAAGDAGVVKVIDADRVYFLMNKPRGVYSTNVAQGAQVRAIDLLPKTFQGRVYPVGRLDAESRGLLLLTNDGELTNQLTHPKFGVAKTYRAVVDGSVNTEGLEQLQTGIWMGDPRSGKGFKTGRSRIKVVKRGREKSVLEITIREGRNRQVRRMLASVGHKVRDLVRVKMGPLTLDGLNPGQCRLLSRREVKELRGLAEKRRVSEARSEQVDGESRTRTRVSRPRTKPTR